MVLTRLVLAGVREQAVGTSTVRSTVADVSALAFGAERMAPERRVRARREPVVLYLIILVILMFPFYFLVFMGLT
jgi:hypothetical protein